MFIGSVTVKGKKYYRLVESYRENGKVKQRYIAEIGNQDNFDLSGAEIVTDILRDFTDIPELHQGDKKTTNRAVMDRAKDLVRGVK